MEEFILKYGVVILSCIATLASIVIALIKAKHSGNNTRLIDLLAEIPMLVIKAEAMFGHKHGAEKLDYVLTQLRIKALQRGVSVTDEYLVSQVNSVVNATKNVNTATSPSQESYTAGDTCELDNNPVEASNTIVEEVNRWK